MARAISPTATLVAEGRVFPGEIPCIRTKAGRIAGEILDKTTRGCILRKLEKRRIRKDFRILNMLGGRFETEQEMTKRQIAILVGLGLLNVMVIGGLLGFVMCSTTTDTLVQPSADVPLVETQQTERLDVFIDLSVELTDGGHVILVGRTNLPNGTIIMTSVKQNSMGFHGGDKVSVREGVFRAGPFGPAGQGLPAGHYLAEALMPYPLAQPTSVRAVIGENGERLIGDLVVRDDVGPIVTLVKEFDIPTQNP